MGEMVLTPYKYSAWNYHTCEVALFLIDYPMQSAIYQCEGIFFLVLQIIQDTRLKKH